MPLYVPGRLLINVCGMHELVAFAPPARKRWRANFEHDGQKPFYDMTNKKEFVILFPPERLAVHGQSLLKWCWNSQWMRNTSKYGAHTKCLLFFHLLSVKKRCSSGAVLAGQRSCGAHRMGQRSVTHSLGHPRRVYHPLQLVLFRG